MSITLDLVCGMIQTRDIAVELGIRCYGTPYIWSGNDPADKKKPGLDCSGFVRYVLRQMGKLPLHGDWTAETLRLKPWPIVGEKKNILPGCLIFYGNSHYASHVMLAVNNEICIGAVGGNSQTTTVRIAKRRGAGVYFRPIDYRGDLMIVLDPFADGVDNESIDGNM